MDFKVNSISLKDLNKQRKKDFYKDDKSENFLENFNKYLFKKESRNYKNYDIKHPIIFVFGLPRSATTLISQLVVSTFDSGFINNIAARFYLAPLHGIRISNAILGTTRATDYKSNYAITSNLADIHEFGYFWRHWLKKETLDDIALSQENENKIDWQGLKKVLANIQNEFDKPLIFKNIFGSYHLSKINSLFQKVLFIYIERDELDVAVSILNARNKYNSDLNTWWSYAPLEINKLLKLNYWEQIAGQIFYLKKFYCKEIDGLDQNTVVRVHYENLCKNPLSVIEEIKNKCYNSYNYELELIQLPPKSFAYKTFSNEIKKKNKFKKLLQEFRNE